ncbi:hypothetical protein PTKIN_Ptkin06aG0190700 [Pterospermum kingtungense]
MGLSGAYTDPVPDDVGISIIKNAFDRGITFFDASDIYGPKTNKMLVRKHRVDTNTPIEDTMGELKRLVEEGKRKYIGLFEGSPAVHPITALQMEWELDIGVVPYSSLVVVYLVAKQLALTWVLRQGDNVSPIPAVKLTAEDLKEICDVFTTDEVAGAALPYSSKQFTWKFGNTPPKESKILT